MSAGSCSSPKLSQALQRPQRPQSCLMDTAVQQRTNNQLNTHTPQPKTQSKTISYADVIGQRTENPTKSTNAKTNSGDSTTKSKVEFGDFKITIDTPPGTTLSQKQLNDIFNNEKFKQYMTNLTKQGSGSGVVSYVG